MIQWGQEQYRRIEFKSDLLITQLDQDLLTHCSLFPDTNLLGHNPLLK